MKLYRTEFIFNFNVVFKRLGIDVDRFRGKIPRGSENDNFSRLKNIYNII